MFSRLLRFSFSGIFWVVYSHYHVNAIALGSLSLPGWAGPEDLAFRQFRLTALVAPLSQVLPLRGKLATLPFWFLNSTAHLHVACFTLPRMFSDSKVVSFGVISLHLSDVGAGPSSSDIFSSIMTASLGESRTSATFFFVLLACSFGGGLWLLPRLSLLIW